ncbi:hypothetical protein SY83_07035 [Paenibacillus swuensis]|uniref:HTH araC/xylS-type domain-containing protein n=1 Tax=Paenibacillus swuensis TaxID=1178515 RepID=A0A172TG98_9BACL|nr:AraC family transcriptional regulator [Paenibacillus swuensis]ANE46078.1 hypothetical protein SY83_07035 [Paenibacillus swuensis]
MYNPAFESIQIASIYGKIACERTWRWNRGSIPFEDFDLWYIWNGEGEIVLNGNKQRLGRHQCFLFRPGDRVDAWHHPERPLTVTYIHFSIDSITDEFPGLLSNHEFRTPFYFEAYLERFVHVMTMKELNHHDEARLLLRLILLAFERECVSALSSLTRSNHPHYAVMTEIAALIRENPANVNSVAELAERAYLSPRYFSLKFKEVMGQTVERYIIEKRIERAELLLSTHGMSVGEVADALGYQNIYYFSKQFKKVRGISPSKI